MVPAKRPRFAITWETLSGDRERLLDAEDERLRVWWMSVLRNCDDCDRIRLRVGLFWGSIGVGGVSVIIGVCLGAIESRLTDAQAPVFAFLELKIMSN
jgi:hypothetical protein